MNIKKSRAVILIVSILILISTVSAVTFRQVAGTSIDIWNGQGNRAELIVDAKIWCEEKQEWVDKLKITLSEFNENHRLHFRCTVAVKESNFTAVLPPDDDVNPTNPIEDLSEIVVKDYLPLNLRYVEGSASAKGSLNYRMAYDEQHNILIWKIKNDQIPCSPTDAPNRLTYFLNITFDVYPVYAGVGKNYFTVSIGGKKGPEEENVIGSRNLPPPNVIELPEGGYMVYDEDLVGIYGIDRFVSVSIVPEGAGRVEFSINKSYFVRGDEVTLYAIPNAGYEFDHWSGDLSGNENPARIVVDSRKNITAHFRYVGSTTDENQNSGQNSTGNYSIQIIRPENRIYLFDMELFRFSRPIIIGQTITVVANASEGIEYVAFYIDDNLQGISGSRPFMWGCVVPRGTRAITVLGLDINGTVVAEDVIYATCINMLRQTE